MNKFLDFDRDKNIIYYNIFLNDNEIIIKIPLISKSDKGKHLENLTIEHLDVFSYRYHFLFNCDQYYQ